jgi:hypothetical protein
VQIGVSRSSLMRSAEAMDSSRRRNALLDVEVAQVAHRCGGEVVVVLPQARVPGREEVRRAP